MHLGPNRGIAAILWFPQNPEARKPHSQVERKTTGLWVLGTDSNSRVRILLPPSETKQNGGTGAPLALADLSFPALTKTRTQLVRSIVSLGAKSRRAAAREALGLSANQDDEIARNAAIRSSPTAPALDRYSGVLFDALDASSLRPAQRASIWIASALFGVLAADDPVPGFIPFHSIFFI